jgi:large subunit ribosomal protein L17
MPHQIAKKRLSRTDGHRRALLRSLATSFFKHERIETTTTKAKEVSKVVERLITTARRGDLHSRRLVAAYLLEAAVVKKLCDHIAPALKERTGGFTRITKTRVRPGDAAELSILELVAQ